MRRFLRILHNIKLAKKGNLLIIAISYFTIFSALNQSPEKLSQIWSLNLQIRAKPITQRERSNRSEKQETNENRIRESKFRDGREGKCTARRAGGRPGSQWPRFCEQQDQAWGRKNDCSTSKPSPLANHPRSSLRPLSPLFPSLRLCISLLLDFASSLWTENFFI